MMENKKETKMNPVVHFEMPYENRERLVKFYTKAFGNNFFERKLNVAATTRNLNTMVSLVDLAAAQQKALQPTPKGGAAE